VQGGAALATGALAPLALGAESAAEPRRGQPRRIGLLGCGGRGAGAAAQALKADPDNVLVALGDVFPDMLANTLASLTADLELAPRVDVPEGRQFVGFNSYKQVIDACDVVLLCTSPHFRPLHTEYAVKQGKHMFIEKPVAVDAPGLRRFWAASDEARAKGLALMPGLCYRYEKKKQEIVRRVHEGAIGDIVALECSYNTGGLWHRGRQESWSDMEWQMRNWLYHTWLSGDHVVEQAIHNLDKALWVMGDVPPVSVVASGGRSVRTDPMYGNVFDHFNARLRWESGQRCFFSCRQWSGAKSEVSDHIYGKRGVAHIQTHRIEGENPWSWRAPEEFVDDMYQNEHDELFRSLREGQPVHGGDYLCKATLMAIMVRMSAYTGQEITWNQALESTEDLTPAAYEWGDLEVGPIAVPGVTPFV